MIFVECTLDYPSGIYKFYNPTTDAIVISNSVRWSDFKPQEATNLEEDIRNLKTATLGKIKEIIKSSDEIELEHNIASDANNEVSTPSVPTLPTLPLPAQPTGRITRSMTVSDYSTQPIHHITRSMDARDDTLNSDVYSEHNDQMDKLIK